ncbi:DUF3793 family protein [Romboutsia sp. 1001713B170131_170501_G6]|uniref:DUF3793 family protein n=1 Tax=Romboutsia sp. 1001713B170131_170501_G6 TaxID=2787108 RepID=UPI001FAD3708|nr:DUF3793 family protein [Romboutsia sp. 1001713B170131_170501_G6]
MNCYSCKNNINSSYIKWLLEILGPVLMGSKPCEILSIPSFDKNKDSKIDDIKNHFNLCKKIDYIIIDKKEKGLKLLFINKDSLSTQLNNKKIHNFLKYLGYPSNLDIDLYLNHLINKLEGNNFPDEIGIFLGYPLKDVVGFMGYGSYKFHNTKYWRVYGDPKPSEDLYFRFLNHREKLRDMLKSQSVKYILSSF